MKRWVSLILATVVVSALNGCTFKKAEFGSAENPVKVFFVPSVEAKVIEGNTATLKAYLEANTPYKYTISIPQSYIAIVEAFGSKRADVAAINTFGYILANEKYGAEAMITVVRHGKKTYGGQIVVRTDSKIKEIMDLEGKKVAFVDPASTSGYLLPLKMLADAKVSPKDTVFAQKHDSVISMVYQGQVDAGATFYSPPADGEIQDARRLVKTQYPDVEKKIRILKLTEEIPNDPIIFRKDMAQDMKETIAKAMVDFAGTPEGKVAWKAIYGVTEIERSGDKDYDGVRELLKKLGKSADTLVK